MICISTQISTVYMIYCTKNHFFWWHEKFHQESMQLRGLQRVVLEVHWKRQILPKGNDMKVRYFLPFLRFQIFSMHQLLKGILVDRQNLIRKSVKHIEMFDLGTWTKSTFFLDWIEESWEEKDHLSDEGGKNSDSWVVGFLRCFFFLDFCK